MVRFTRSRKEVDVSSITALLGFQFDMTDATLVEISLISAFDVSTFVIAVQKQSTTRSTSACVTWFIMLGR